MEGTHSQRLARLVRSFFTQPRDVPSYLACLPAWKRTPLDLGLPWFSFGSIRYLRRAVLPTHTVFEFGSGGSTVFLARRARSVVCVENDPAWHAAVGRRVRELRLTNVDCQLHVFDDRHADLYPELPYFQALAKNTYDVIVVDGFCGFSTGGHGKLRPYALAQACAAVRRPGWVILDDAWMFPDAQRIAGGVKPLVFKGLGPCRYGVTSTAIFQFP